MPPINAEKTMPLPTPCSEMITWKTKMWIERRGMADKKRKQAIANQIYKGRLVQKARQSGMAKQQHTNTSNVVLNHMRTMKKNVHKHTGRNLQRMVFNHLTDSYRTEKQLAQNWALAEQQAIIALAGSVRGGY